MSFSGLIDFLALLLPIYESIQHHIEELQKLLHSICLKPHHAGIAVPNDNDDHWRGQGSRIGGSFTFNAELGLIRLGL